MNHRQESIIQKALLLALPLLLAGCISFQEVTDHFHREMFYIHTVRWPGETLSIISNWYTGKGENWKLLAKANPELDPHRIRMGEKIRIPEKIMERKTPLPKEFLPSRSLLLQEQAVPKAESEEETPELFGPKPFLSR